MNDALLLLGLPVFLAGVLFCRILARKTGRSEELWTLVGAFAGPIAVVYLWHSLSKQRSAKRNAVPPSRAA